jgi:hypothetical protein
MILKDVVEMEIRLYKKLGPDLKETDQIQNKISRAYIRTFKKHHGKCFMGKFGSIELKEYKRGMVRNFECDFIIPCNCKDIPVICWQAAIHKINSLEGVILRWV